MFSIFDFTTVLNVFLYNCCWWKVNATGWTWPSTTTTAALLSAARRLKHSDNSFINWFYLEKSIRNGLWIHYVALNGSRTERRRREWKEVPWAIISKVRSPITISIPVQLIPLWVISLCDSIISNATDAGKVTIFQFGWMATYWQSCRDLRKSEATAVTVEVSAAFLLRLMALVKYEMCWWLDDVRLG